MSSPKLQLLVCSLITPAFYIHREPVTRSRARARARGIQLLRPDVCPTIHTVSDVGCG
jgi:hypothetical protein